MNNLRHISSPTVVFTVCVLALSACGGRPQEAPRDSFNLAALRSAAETGRPDDQYRFALALQEAPFTWTPEWWGKRKPRSDAELKEPYRRKEVEVIEWYRKAADAGHLKAKTNLGYRLSQNLVIRDYAEAVRVLREAAAAGDIKAAVGLAEYYDPHVGWSDQEVDVDEAIKWYERVAAEGGLGAQNRLGELFYKEKKDLVSAYAWLLVAKTAVTRRSSNLTPSGRSAFDELEKKMFSLQKTEAEKLAIELMKRYPRHNQNFSDLPQHSYYEEFGHQPPRSR